jgi:hypothetical protein
MCHEEAVGTTPIGHEYPTASGPVTDCRLSPLATPKRPFQTKSCGNLGWLHCPVVERISTSSIRPRRNCLQPQSFNGILDCLTVWIERGVLRIH